ncbi:glycoside hydrolase family 3 C-terminal domain-containing protein [Robertkochia solimangrovi]|uniref:glycoside hydrolase family 3 C-terminal domain-containing protein n=1 Tax=Robertkochia solimangrovi TaxID=2213046 RepID=UPI00117CE00A|nr:glycoside hydrolase family 3 C-terminal domain-containing protein [Robertkochia solimangrovi]TRZ42295.1 beta-glucosidase [Robertkochia solimangrovi]
MCRYIYIFILLITFPSVAQERKFPFQDPSIAIEERINNLLSLMTLDEKVAALSTDPSVPRLGVTGTKHVEGLHGLALGGPAQWGGKNKDPLPTTTFPQAYGLGETWDRELLQQVAAIEGIETRFAFQKYGRGGLVVRAPNADLGRDPRWGRTEECYGEDPFLTGSLTVAFIKGLQGDDPFYWQTAALMKHFLANSNEDGRTYTSSDFNERLWHEYYAAPFRMGILEGGSRAYMAAYNKVNGIPAMVHPMLKEITVEQWGQNGIICTDGGAYRLLISDHHYYPDKYLGAAATIKAGINQFLDDHTEGIYGAIANGYLTEKDIDDVLKGVYRVMIHLGMLDPADNNPYATIGKQGETDLWETEMHKKTALLASQKSIVLLKNDPQNSLLPLQKEKIKSIAIIGKRADNVLEDWYSGTPPYMISPLEGIKNQAGAKIKVTYVPYNADGKAVAAARNADVAIVITGNHPTCDAGWADCPLPDEGKESVDRQSLDLPEENLIKLISKANPNTVVVLISSFPYSINWTADHIPAILHMANNGQETGNALASVLFGTYNPAGRLTQTWVRSITDLPDLMDYDITHGRTYRYFKGDPLFAFGHGLSYTSFAYTTAELIKTRYKADEDIELTVKITNTGDRDGEEVIQLYASFPESSVVRPLKQLIAFDRTHIEKGSSRSVTLKIPAKRLAFWDGKRFKVEKGKVLLSLGPASDKLLQTLQITII